MSRSRSTAGWLAALLLSGAPGAFAESAIDVARKYSDAFLRGDCTTMEALTSDVVRRGYGGRQALRDFLCDFRAHLQREGMQEWHEEFVGSIASFQHEATVVEFIQKRRVSVWTDRIMRSEQPYVVHSGDGGRTWKVLDIGCLGDKWVKRIAPTWRGDPPLPASSLVVEKR